MNNKLKTPEMDQFFRAVLSLRTEKECYAFFEDICTVSELLAIAQRLQVAKMLSEEARYQDICDRTGPPARRSVVSIVLCIMEKLDMHWHWNG